MYDRTTHVGYIQFVEEWNAWELISSERHIALGSTIYSDGWASYRRLPRAKRKIKAVYGSRFHLILSYLDEFMWRERFGQHTAASQSGNEIFKPV
eukprot:gene16609-biopygen14031